VPLVVGGTGLYFRAALSGFELPPPAAPGRRDFWQAEYDRLGAATAHAALAERDAAAARRVHPNDRKRVVRALELADAGHSLAPEHDRLWTEDTRLPTTIVALELPLEELDARIDERTRAMARKVMGLEQFATLPEDEAIEAVAQATRRLARYQRKWLRKMPGVARLDGTRPAAEVADEIIALGREREHLSGH
jgi:tRNA dimethylallyltransferase